jgi:hypothetical protein
MPKYKVNKGKGVNAGGGMHYAEDAEFELSEEEAAGLVENGTVSLVAEATKAQPLPKQDPKK